MFDFLKGKKTPHSPVETGLDDGWKQWIATNLMQDATPEELVGILASKGFSREIAEKEIFAAANHPYVLAGKPHFQRLKKRDWVFATTTKLDLMAGPGTQVERRQKLSRQEFFEQYYFKNRPVVIQGMLEQWPALTKWEPEYLKDVCGEQIVEVQFGRNSDRDYEINQTQFRKQMPFSDYIDMLPSAETNDFYITANNTSINGKALEALWPDVPLITEYMKEQDPYPGFFWYGPKGTITPLHHDLTNNFMAQVRGRKLVKIISPWQLPFIYNHQHCYSKVDLGNIDYQAFPGMQNVRVIDVVLEPGDLFFLPVGYWHYVQGLDISITMTYTNFLADNDFNSFYSTYGPL